MPRAVGVVRVRSTTARARAAQWRGSSLHERGNPNGFRDEQGRARHCVLRPLRVSIACKTLGGAGCASGPAVICVGFRFFGKRRRSRSPDVEGQAAAARRVGAFVWTELNSELYSFGLSRLLTSFAMRALASSHFVLHVRLIWWTPLGPATVPRSAFSALCPLYASLPRLTALPRWRQRHLKRSGRTRR